MEEVRAKHAFATKPDFLRNPLRRLVVGVGDELEALEAELLEAVATEQPEGARRHAAPARWWSAPVADVPVAELLVEAEPDRPDRAVALRDRELSLAGRGFASNEGSGVVFRVRPGNDRNPTLNVRIVARVDERRHVVHPPGPKLEITVLEHHVRTLERRPSAPVETGHFRSSRG